MTNENLTGAQLIEIVSTVVVFQFVPPKSDEDQIQSERNDRVPVYYDKLNSWLGQILERDIVNVIIRKFYTEMYGVTIKIYPFDCTENPPNSDDVDNIVACLEQQIVG